MSFCWLRTKENITKGSNLLRKQVWASFEWYCLIIPAAAQSVHQWDNIFLIIASPAASSLQFLNVLQECALSCHELYFCQIYVCFWRFAMITGLLRLKTYYFSNIISSRLETANISMCFTPEYSGIFMKQSNSIPIWKTVKIYCQDLLQC